MRKIILVFIFTFTLCAVCLAQSNYTESLTITTYYPAPYGVYRNLRLHPSNLPTGPGVLPGVMYYDQTPSMDMIRYRNSTGWVNVTAGGGGGWTESGNNIYKTNIAGNVGIGTPAPAGKLDVLVAAADTTSPLVVGKGANNYVTVLNNGNVSIGTTNPRSNLHIYGTPAKLILNGNSGTGVGGEIGRLTFMSDGDDRWAASIQSYVPAYTEGAEGIDFTDLRFFTSSWGCGAGAIVSTNVPCERMRITHGGNVGIGTTNPGAKLEVVGNILHGGSCVSSDRRWKNNVAPLSDSLKKIMQLQGVNFEWDREHFSNKGFTEGKQIGLVAQDVEQVIPELVQTDKEGYKSISYEKFTAVLLEAVKEQQKRIESLEAKVRALEGRK